MMKQNLLISLKDISRHYAMASETIKALDHVDLDIFKGEFLTLAGPSGSGKSTMLNLIGLLDTPTTGDVYFNDENVAHLSPAERALLRRDLIGFVFQSFNLVPVLNVAENIEFVMLLQGKPEDERKARVEEMLLAVDLQGMESRFPNELSGGQQQRVAVARALAAKPMMILADEPTANLDSVTGEKLIDMMENLNENYGITFVFSTHDPKLINRSKRLVQIRDGHIDSVGLKA